jgi:hypothetical protein
MAIAVIEIGGLAYRIRQNNYGKGFQPAANFLRAQATAQSSIAAGSGVAFGLGFPANVIHDPALGYNSGKRFDYIVIDPESAYSIDSSKGRDAKLYDYTMRLLNSDYDRVYDQRSYTIYARK